MNYSDIKIGNIYKLKPSQEVWCIDIQQRFIYPSDCRTYVKVTNTVFDHRTLFGIVVEENAFGAIEKYEIEFLYTQLEDNIEYSSIEEFNKSVLQETRLPYMDFPDAGKHLSTTISPLPFALKQMEPSDTFKVDLKPVKSIKC